MYSSGRRALQPEIQLFKKNLKILNRGECHSDEIIGSFRQFVVESDSPLALIYNILIFLKTFEKNY